MVLEKIYVNMTTLILHGIMGQAGENWMQWLHDELIKQGHNVIMPQLPESDKPDRTEWLHNIQKLLAPVKDEVIIVGHSLGVTSALDYCESTDKIINSLVSVSGFARAYGMELNNYFLAERTLDIEKVKQHVRSFYVIYGDNDPYVPQDVLHELATDLDVEPVVVYNGGHLNSAAGYDELPEILEYILTIS